MGKKSSNPLNVLKSAINKAGDTVAQTYTEVSKDVSKVATQVIPQNIVTKLELESETKSETKSELMSESEKEFKLKQLELDKINAKTKIVKDELTPFEKHIQSLYVGCFSDDPSNPSMENYLGEVSNSLECIEFGKKNNFKYVGVQQGNKCFGSNKIPTTEKVDKKVYCNIGCDDINTGNCGGFFYNQVYKTTTTNPNTNILQENQNKILSENILEKFINLDTDIEKINYGLSHSEPNTNPNSIYPIDSYTLFFWICVLVILLYLLFEYIYKKSNKK